MRVIAKTDLSAVCPYELNDSKCLHCDPEEAPCVKACPKDAIYVVADGVLAIDYDKCDGCGECAKACPANAIVLKAGKAFKCDLCLSLFDEPQCVIKDLAEIKYSEEELEHIWDSLGWAVLEKGDWHVELPKIRLWEAELIRGTVERYTKLRGEFSWQEVLEGIEYEEGEIPPETKRRVLWWIEKTYEEFGPISFLQDEHIEEIAVVRLKEPIRVYVKGEGWKETNLAFWREDYFIYVVNKFAALVGRRITLKTPRVNAILPDGSRMHAVIPPISTGGHSLTIRRFATRRFTPWDLIESGTATAKQMAELWLAIEEERNIVIAGNTGSGKTTTLNAMLAFVPLHERVILVEETPEIYIPHRHSVRLVPTEDIGMQELVYDTLRMRPDRIVVGEVRRPEEMRALFDTMLAGQGKGSYATMHGRSVEETINRIRSMGIPEEDIKTLDVLVIQKRRGTKGGEIRKIENIVWFCGQEHRKDDVKKRAAFLKRLKEKDLEEYAKRVMKWAG